jgi:hypothetical protein
MGLTVPRSLHFWSGSWCSPITFLKVPLTKFMKTILIAVCLAATQTFSIGAEKSSAAPPTSLNELGANTRVSGRVVETMNAAGYTYVQVNTGAKKLWAAVPELKTKVGDSILIADGMAMENHHSKTLNRDFELIYFEGDVLVNDKRPVTEEKSIELPKNHPPITHSTSAPKVDLAGIKRVPGGKTVGDLCSQNEPQRPPGCHPRQGRQIQRHDPWKKLDSSARWIWNRRQKRFTRYRFDSRQSRRYRCGHRRAGLKQGFWVQLQV